MLSKKFLSIAISILLVLTMLPVNALAIETSYVDSASEWAYDSITESIQKGFVPFEIQNNYREVITRAEFCRMAVMYIEYVTGMSISSYMADKDIFIDWNAFADTQDYYILAAYALGVTSGTGNKQFTPNGRFPREQAATMIRNVCNVLGVDVNNPSPSGFADIGTASSWAIDGINFVRANGIMTGTGNNHFSPKALYTREQSIVTFNNIVPDRLPGIITQAITFTPAPSQIPAPIPTPSVPPTEIIKTLIGIEVIPPDKITYNIGENFNSSGMVVIATYSDNTTRNVTSSCAISGFNSSVGGVQTITVSYSENGLTQTTRFSVTINARVLTGLEVIPPEMVDYYVGASAFSSYGLVATAIYSDGSTRDVSPGCGFGFNVSVDTRSVDSSTAGSKPVTVSYTENGVTVTAQYTINIIYRELSSISISLEPSQLGAYTAFIIRVWASYSNGTGNFIPVEQPEYGWAGWTYVWTSNRSFTVSYTESGITKSAQHTVASVYWDWIDNALKPLG